MTTFRSTALMLALMAPLGVAHAAGLGGSPSSMVHQHEIAVKEEFSFLRTPGDVTHLVELGGLVPIVSGDDHTLSGVSFPYARPVVKQFIDRFAAEFRDSTGHALVVTSLTRPAALQPRNAHKLSVHPAGMAVDFRVPADARDRAFLERALLEMERTGVLDVTREKSPAHYHVAVFPEEYVAWEATQPALQTRAAIAAAAMPAVMLAGVVSESFTDAAADPASRIWQMLLVMTSLLGLAIPAIKRPRPHRA